ncbi:DUF5683 domain-containing protein [Mucilaginibacter psychrotolerans]|uniref:DUF5683 domain-containing protein n=1 Tax=Mucilaginibacter psychrotolerans TaxID=1524096 RepID=A0A4Y8SH75_9SPHI|nr:DUF5683 domain-containing protein [Mucilaginibacter psychrotolerans]TFF37980.1 hypothetical protein E2R66_10360 [Mucilaginibacter psychrotolerans]
MLKQTFVFLLFLSFAGLCHAQTVDTVVRAKDAVKVVKRDTVARGSFAPKIKKEKVYHPDSTHIPSLAVKRSLLVPGWGQVYNKKYWKVPLIYGGLGLLGAAVIYNQQYFKQFLALAKLNKVGTGQIPAETSPLYPLYVKYKVEYELYSRYDYQTLADASDGYLRNRDLSILGLLAVWGVQAIDAYIDAKFINSYTVDNNLSMRVTPGFINQPVFASNFNGAYIPGIKITFTLK